MKVREFIHILNKIRTRTLNDWDKEKFENRINQYILELKK